MMSIRVVVVDDEPLARLNITSALQPHARWQVLGEAGDATAGAAVVRRTCPDVVFLDIQMPGKNGMECASDLLALESPPLIVFVTAYDDYTLQAFELFAMDYLLKPFDDDRFDKTVTRIEGLIDSKPTHSLTSARQRQRAYVDQKSYITQIVIRSSRSLRIVRVEEIRWLKASGNYVEVVHTNGRHLQRVQLSYIATRLDPDAFCRIHRSVIVALREVTGYRSRADGSGEVILVDGHLLPVSARYRPDLFKQLGLD